MIVHALQLPVTIIGNRNLILVSTGQRPYQEDRYTIIPDYAALLPGSFRGSVQCGHRAPPASYAAIFDGHMSYKAAELAANRLHHNLARGMSMHVS